MADREKVKKGLDLCLTGEASACKDCPYDAECKEARGIGPSPLRRDALELLKEQKDTVRRVNMRWEMGIHGGNCPKCLNWVQLSYNYCPFCGAKMDEEGK